MVEGRTTVKEIARDQRAQEIDSACGEEELYVPAERGAATPASRGPPKILVKSQDQ